MDKVSVRGLLGRAWRWIKWVGGVFAVLLGILSFVAPTAGKYAGARGEVANMKKLQAEIAPELAQLKADTPTPIEVGDGVILTEVQVFESQIKFVYQLDMDDPMDWLADYSQVNGEGSLCNEESGYGYHLLTHGMTQMQDFHSQTTEGRKVFRQLVRKPFECRGKPGFEFLTARR